MAKRPVVKQDEEEARRRFGERITEQTGEGLIIRRQDGTVQRVGKGGKLEPAEE
jgi:hypothetical protein